MHALVRRFFSVEYMVKPGRRLGELPPSGAAYRNLISIALPSVLEMVLMSLIGSIDTMMVGTLGHEAIAAVGLVGQPRMLMLAIFFALNTGVTAIVARRKGEGRQESANQTMRTALVMILRLSIIMMGVALIFSRQLMNMAGAKADTIEDANTYFRILAYFLPVNAITMCMCAAMRGVGNTKITMWVNIASNLVNVVFNYLLIGGNLGFPKLGVAGAAIATCIGFCVGCVLCIYAVLPGRKHDSFLQLSFRGSWKPDRESMLAITKVGGNAMIEQVALRFGFFVYARIVADLGTVAFAAHQVCMQFLNITFTFGDGLGVAGTSLVGQMMGKERPDLSQMYGKISQRLALCVSLTLLSFLVVLRYPLVHLFVSEPEVVELAANVMLMVAVFQPFQTSSVVLSGCLRGAGDTRFVACVMILCVAGMRPLLSYIAIHYLGMGLVGAWSASLIDMTVRMLCVYVRFSGGKWYNIKV